MRMKAPTLHALAMLTVRALQRHRRGEGGAACAVRIANIARTRPGSATESLDFTAVSRLE